MQSKNYYYSCVVDATALFCYQTWGLVNSLIQNAHVHPSHIVVHYTSEVDANFIVQLQSLNINIVPISRFGDGKYCNKITQLRNPLFKDAECVFLMDADMVVLGDLQLAYTPDVISGKVVDLPNPDIAILKEIFDLAGMTTYPAICNVDVGDGHTFQNNVNGGLYVIPGKFIDQLSPAWEKWALWLLDNMAILVAAGKQNHVDQITFSLATHECSLPVNNISKKYNYPLHLPVMKSGYPTVLHYHRNLSKLGMVEVDAECDDEFKRAVQDANKLLGSCFNNLVFWSFRYEMFPELGSGVGSRAQNLLYKRELLRHLDVENSPSVLDVGCGDLEVLRELHFKGYTGVDISAQAIQLARSKRPDLGFVLLEGDAINAVAQADTVLCMEVLIHQKNADDYHKLIAFLASHATRRLIVSGYAAKQEHHDTNHMLRYHESLLDSLSSTGKFSKITRVGAHSDVEIFMAEV